jgi:peptide deformylase
MLLPIVQYGHPALRAKGRRIEKFDAQLRSLAENMIATMYDADGLGLAAQQVGLGIQLCVIDVAGVTDRPSEMRVGGNVVDIEDYMPIVLVNPEVEPTGAPSAASEGCLSFPSIGAEIVRSSSVRVRAQMVDGSTLEFEADGLLARAVQHEHDHLHGILFIDRMDSEKRASLANVLERMIRQNAIS